MSRKSIAFVAVSFALLLGSAVSSYAQAPAAELPVDEIIRKFAEKEKEFKLARENYAFRQEIKVEELSNSNRVIGEYQTITEVSFDDKGRRTEKVVYAPPPTLDRLGITAEDLQDFREIQPFVLTSDEIGKYNLKYGGKEKIDEITTYVFDVSPKKIEKGQRYFEGKIWVDDQDLQIVKTYGKSVPDLRAKDGGNENLFPKFETYRQPIDSYWFPTFTRAVDTLNFSSGAVKIRETIRYGNYRKFQTSVDLRFDGELTEGATGAKTPAVDDKKAPALDPKYKNDPKQEPKK